MKKLYYFLRNPDAGIPMLDEFVLSCSELNSCVRARVPAALSSARPRICSWGSALSTTMNGYSWLRCLSTVMLRPPTSLLPRLHQVEQKKLCCFQGRRPWRLNIGAASILVLSSRYLWTHHGLSGCYPAQKMGSRGALPLQPSSPPGDPPQLQFPEHHQRLQGDICIERHTPHYLDWRRVKHS